MATVVVYGASDDLIEVEVYDSNKPGEPVWSEEYAYTEDPLSSILIVGMAGQVVQVSPVLTSAGWASQVSVVRPGSRGHEAIYEIQPRSGGNFETGDTEARVLISGGIPLVYKTVTE